MSKVVKCLIFGNVAADLFDGFETELRKSALDMHQMHFRTLFRQGRVCYSSDG